MELQWGAWSMRCWRKKRWQCWLRIMITSPIDSRRWDWTSTFGNWMNSHVNSHAHNGKISQLGWVKEKILIRPGAPSSSPTEHYPFSSIKTLHYPTKSSVTRCPSSGKSRLLCLETAPLPPVALCWSMFTQVECWLPMDLECSVSYRDSKFVGNAGNTFLCLI